MAAKPETNFGNALRLAVQEGGDVYSMKNNNEYITGIPDVWFSGNGGDLWVELKFVPKLPVKVPLRPGELLSPMQKEWLKDRYHEGRNVAVIIGCKRQRHLEGIILTDLKWEEDIPPQQIEALIASKSELAQWIREQVT